MQQQIYSPLGDDMFTELFGDQSNSGITAALLKSILDIPEDEYKELTVKSPFLKRIFNRGKGGIVDIRLNTTSGRVIHIELQVQKRADTRKRVIYYPARLLGEQLNRGEDYDKLHQVITIVICDHVLIEESPSYINIYEMRNHENKQFTDLLKLVILELPKVPAEEDHPVWPWLQLFKCKEAEEYEMLAKKHPEVKEAVSTLKKLSWFEERRMIKQQLALWKVDERLLREQWQKEAKAEGLAKGRAEGQTAGLAKGRTTGLAEGRTEVARNMKRKGRPFEQIIEDTGLTAEEIEKL
jgi:predicted transposase/invertase (TIGR01784 family)